MHTNRPNKFLVAGMALMFGALGVGHTKSMHKAKCPIPDKGPANLEFEVEQLWRVERFLATRGEQNHAES